jgi:type IV secretion system protein VirB3
MSTENPGLKVDPLFVGATRPPMRWGVSYSALLFNLVFTMEAFLLTKNLLTLLCCAPIHRSPVGSDTFARRLWKPAPLASE